MDVSTLTLKEIQEGLRSKKFTAPHLAEAYLNAIKKSDGDIHAFLEVYEDVMEQAKEAQKRIDAGTAGPLTGIPIAVKDNILIQGKTASSGSKILEHYKATYDATVISKLKEAGVVFLGRTNMDEFAMGGSTENSAYGVTRNPHDHSRVPGGSSGGSAAAVAAGFAPAALGSDTGGSIREPASFCGIVGLKPTYGAVSRHGLMAMASSLDQIGPFAKTVEDAEMLFNAIKGKDRYDATSQEAPMRATGKPNKIGVPRKLLKEGVDADVLSNFEDSLEKLKKQGYEIVDIELPYFEYSLPVYYIIVPAEVSSNMARYDGIKYGESEDAKNLLDVYLKTRGTHLGKEVRRRIILGTYVLSAGYYDAYYDKAIRLRNLIRKSIEDAFVKVDAIALPTSPLPAFKIGEKMNDPISMYLCDVFTVSANVAGVPAISIPSGFAEREGKKLPLGFQLLAPHFGEDTLFVIGKDFEK